MKVRQIQGFKQQIQLKATSMKKPNILFAFADDWGRYASIYKKIHGDASLSAAISTPTIDRIANEGVLFTNALVPAPTCTPCRSSVLSGRYFWQTRLGAILQGAVWDPEIPSFPRLLEDAGYHTGATYKVWGPGDYAGTTPYGTEDHYYDAAGIHFANFSFCATENMEKGMSPEAAKQPLYEEVRNNFNSFLAKRNDDQPFCYWWGPTNTHRGWQKGSGKKLWNIDPDTLKGRLPDFFSDVHDIREDVADYLGECMAFDRGLSVLIEELEKRGELDNTFVVVSGDHGIPGFPRAKCNLYDIGCEVALMARYPGIIPAGELVEDLTNLMDLAPTFLDAAGLSADAGMAGQSLLGRMTGKVPAKLPEEDWVITGRERHVARARDGNLPYPQRAIRTKDFLYIINLNPERWPMGDPKGLDDPKTIPPAFDKLENDTFVAYADLDASPTKAWMVWHRGEVEHNRNFELGFGKRLGEELYDLKKDPQQMTNVAYDEAFADTRKILHHRLITELKVQHDPRLCEERCRYEASPFTDVVHASGEPPSRDAIRLLAAERLSRSGI